MDIKLTFLGAAGNVTGSRYLVEANGARILVDCGMHQEHNLKDRDWKPFAVPPSSLNAVLVSHAHIDHCGYLPVLVKDGFHRRIYCTQATSEIARISLLDSAHMQMEDAAFKKRRHEREGRKGKFPEVPLYNLDNAKAVFPLLTTVSYRKAISLGDGIDATFYEAGHVLGSANIKLTIRQKGETRSILFSGDLGRKGKPILKDPTLFGGADYVLIESTYGDRSLDAPETAADQMAVVINDTAKAKGNIVIPSFAVERTQEILYYLNQFLNADRIPNLLVFLDSPMALEVTEVFERHPELFDQEMADMVSDNKSPFQFPGLHRVRSIEASKSINHILGTVIIMAGSGMCTGGRIKHHLVTNISRPESTILFVGYQAAGTLGRQIVDGAKEVRILGMQYPVRARVASINGFSAHADREELLGWLQAFQKPPRRLFVTHGEPESAQRFAALVREKMRWEVAVPAYLDKVTLD